MSPHRLYDHRMVAVVMLLLSIALASPFGEATASAISDDEGLELEVTVEVDQTFVAVLVRPFSSFEELDPVAMIDRGDGVWGARVVVPSAESWSIVFEGIDADGSVTRSETTDLLELGVDPVVLEGDPTPQPRPTFSLTTAWLALAIILGLGAFAALAWWAFAPDRTPQDEPPE